MRRWLRSSAETGSVSVYARERGRCGVSQLPAHQQDLGSHLTAHPALLNIIRKPSRSINHPNQQLQSPSFRKQRTWTSHSTARNLQRWAVTNFLKTWGRRSPRYQKQKHQRRLKVQRRSSSNGHISEKRKKGSTIASTVLPALKWIEWSSEKLTRWEMKMKKKK